MRKKPDMSALPNNKIPLVKPQNDELITQIRTYQLITSLYGGGVEPEKADEISVVRATEIKGHLRFWWRAIYGGMYDDVNQMRKAEEALWGAAIRRDSDGGLISGPSDVKLTILDSKSGSELSPPRNWQYVTFPLRDTAGKMTKDVSFLLEIKYPNQYKAQIDNTFFAWESFGGIGARTRRGLGALKLISIDKKPIRYKKEEYKNKIFDFIRTINRSESRFFPCLSAELENYKFIEMNNRTSEEIWEYIINKYKEFRQGFRNGDYGRSYWPEADAIRRRKSYARRHNPRNNLPNKFPRAEFGLPIIFKFKDEDVELSPGDPEQTTLQGVDVERLSSPLIFRSIDCSDGALGIVLILNTPRTPIQGLLLEGESGNNHVYSDLTLAEARQIDAITRDNRMNGHTSVLEAFLEFLEL